MLFIRLVYKVLIGINAPHTQRICMIGTHGSHFSVMVMTISSLETIPNPNMAGKDINAVKRSILRNIFWRRSISV